MTVKMNTLLKQGIANFTHTQKINKKAQNKTKKRKKAQNKQKKKAKNPKKTENNPNIKEL